MLMWNLLVCVVFGSLIQFFTDYTSSFVHNEQTYFFFAVIPALCFLVTALLSGCLADTVLGRYLTIRIGLLLMFLSTVIYCVNVLLVGSKALHPSGTATLTIACISYSLLGMGYACFLATSVQLGLDQMPDASSENITSFISWFVFCGSPGLWVGQLLKLLKANCVVDEIWSAYDQIWSLFLVLCMSIVLISDLVLAPTWLIVEPKSVQYLKTVYHVLKFAAKHKAPLNRSAFTYWEEDVPSRIDLGKSKYGGPFTTEQVEDVKTFLRIFTVTIPLWVFCLIILADPVSPNPTVLLPRLTECTFEMVKLFGYSGQWIVVITTLVYEFVVYPLGGHILPNILRRIEHTFFLLTATCTLSLVLTLLSYAGIGVGPVDWVSAIIFSVVNGILTRVYLTSMLEFICAQAPYGMRGLFTGFVYIQYTVPGTLSVSIGYIFTSECTSLYCPVVYWSLMAVLSVVGFLVFCVVARWYKRRVRDDIYAPQRVIEEIYDRYLSQR